jgi:two-component system, sporulation sensor kinase C
MIMRRDGTALGSTKRLALFLAASSLAGAAVQHGICGDWRSTALQLCTTAILSAAAYRVGRRQGGDGKPSRNSRSEAKHEAAATQAAHARKLVEPRAEQEQEKLSMAGILAAGIAHEIRNPLTSLKGFLQLTAAKPKPEYTAIMLSEVDRINEIVTELLELAKPKETAFEERDLSALLEQTVTLLEAQANLSNVTLAMEPGARELPPIIVTCEENKLKQVFINLIKNAIEASAGGGAIRIAVLVSDEQAVVEVADTGSGLPEEQLEQLGQPFYTTKEQGNGLGLMVCRRIVQDHGGTIAFRSEAGEGTVVAVRLPCNPPRMEDMKARSEGQPIGK